MRDASLSASEFQDFHNERAAPKRRGPAASPPPLRAPKKKRSVLTRVFGLQRMGALVLLGIGGLAFVGVPMNALFFQDGHHPAPLFAARTSPPPTAPGKIEAAEAPTPPARPTRLDTARLNAEPVTPEPTKPEPAKSEPAPRAAQKNVARADAAALKAEILKSEAPARAKPPKAAAAKAEKKRDAAARDPIGKLLGAGQPPAAHAATTNKDVYFAQRALQRLGYVVAANGKLDGGARRVIENFERDNGLPVKGQVNPKLLKLLAARSGLSQE